VDTVLERIGLTGIVPVVAIDDAANAVPLARALLAGGIPCIEITFRTSAAREAMERISAEVPEMLLGAGTVLTVAQAETALAAGARYIVSPGLNRAVVEYCQSRHVPVTPGVATPTEIEAALGLGLEIVKFFPAEAMGGLAYLNAIGAPYRSVKFIPTGGIDEQLLLPYLKSPRVHAVGGSWMVKPELIAAHRFAEITALSSKAVLTMLGFDLAHAGVNCNTSDEASRLAKGLSAMFSWTIRAGSTSMFVGERVELTTSPGRGTHGHFGIRTQFIERAVAYLAARGVTTLPDTRHEKDGRLHAVYLDTEVGGFAIHLIQA
jgi:2-dehydro-3-deoxyphosphogluconate aldolase/(4S)-4-hydroxy-2-oxoglutarate aldolase